MANLKLDIEYDFDFEIIGLISPTSAYKMAWEINKLIRIDLIKDKDIKLNFIKKNVIITNYIFREEYSYLRLIKNKSLEETALDNSMSLFDVGRSEYFLPELKKYDYILQLEGKINNLYFDEMIKKLSSIEGIQLVSPIDLDNIKDKDNLIFE